MRGVTGEGWVVGASNMLLPLQLPDAEQINVRTYRIDLKSPAVLQKNAVEAWIPPYPERNLGDRIAVSFLPSIARRNDSSDGLKRYFHLAEINSDPLEHIFIRPLQSLPSGYYEASYMVMSRSGNVSASERVEVDVINSPPVASVSGQVSVYGMYLPGSMHAWIVPERYALSPADVLHASLGKSDAGTMLGIYRAAESEPVFSLKTTDGQNWSCNGGGVVQFERGDLLSVKLEGNANAVVYLAITI